MARTYWVPMVANAIRIIEVFFSAGRDLSLQEIHAQTGVAKTSVLRILSTLEKLGYVHKVPETGRFYLGSKIARAARRVGPGTDLVRIARPELEKLRDRFDETVNLAALQNDQVVYLDILESRQNFRMVAETGCAAPLHSTAVGKCVLAFLPDGQIGMTLKNIKLTRFTRNTIPNRAALTNTISKVRARGYATDIEENELGASCIGVPILDLSFRALAVLSISGPSVRIRKNRKQIIQALKETAGIIADRLGVA
jgi:IclR family transcriptional regulator, KDG regulon repressor